MISCLSLSTGIPQMSLTLLLVQIDAKVPMTDDCLCCPEAAVQDP